MFAQMELRTGRIRRKEKMKIKSFISHVLIKMTIFQGWKLLGLKTVLNCLFQNHGLIMNLKVVEPNTEFV